MTGFQLYLVDVVAVLNKLSTVAFVACLVFCCGLGILWVCSDSRRNAEDVENMQWLGRVTPLFVKVFSAVILFAVFFPKAETLRLIFGG